MARFASRASSKPRVLLIGVRLALLMRGALIAVGATVVDRSSGCSNLFGAFLVYTAITLARQQLGGEQEFKENGGDPVEPADLPADGHRDDRHRGPTD